MRNWGIIITAFYAFVFTSLIIPGVVVVCMWESDGHESSWRDVFEVYDAWLTWRMDWNSSGWTSGSPVRIG